MKKVRPIAALILLQLVFSCLQAYFITKISWIGKLGIRFFYKEYGIFRSGTKTALLFFIIQVAIILISWFLQRRYAPRTSYIAAGIVLLAGITGLLISYQDFQHTYTHRLLKERFHLGFYLFWIGWILNSLFFFVTTHFKAQGLQVATAAGVIDPPAEWDKK